MQSLRYPNMEVNHLPRNTPKKGVVLLDRTTLESELTECRAQRDQARSQLGQAQQVAQNATTNIARCDGAEVQLLSLIAKLEEAEKNGSQPETPGSPPNSPPA